MPVWTVTTVRCEPHAGGVEDFVTLVEWLCYSGERSQSGSLEFAPDPDRAYRPGFELTEDELLGWVFAQVDKAVIEAAIESA